jgi:flagellar biosynthetic protein FliR
MVLDHVLSGALFGYLLVFARLGTITMLLPGFGELSVPARIRLALALAITLVIYPLVHDTLPPQPDRLLPLAFTVGGEVAVGALIGGTGRIIFSALHVAGTVIAYMTSLSFAQSVDPGQGGQSVTVTTFLSVLGVALIFASGLHYVMIAAMRDSYLLFVPAHLPDTGDFGQLAVAMVGRAFALGIQIAAPFLVFGLLFNIGLGLVSRLMPQLQIFFIAAPAQILAGFGILLVTLGAGMTLFLTAFGDSWTPLTQ